MPSFCPILSYGIDSDVNFTVGVWPFRVQPWPYPRATIGLIYQGEKSSKLFIFLGLWRHKSIICIPAMLDTLWPWRMRTVWPSGLKLGHIKDGWLEVKVILVWPLDIARRMEECHFISPMLNSHRGQARKYDKIKSAPIGAILFSSDRRVKTIHLSLNVASFETT